MNATAPPSPECKVPSARATGALILGGAHGSLAFARSLGRRGIPVWFVTDDHPIARYSRYVERSFAWAGANDEGAIEFLKSLARQHGLDGWLLIAGGDPEVRLLSQHPGVAARRVPSCQRRVVPLPQRKTLFRHLRRRCAGSRYSCARTAPPGYFALWMFT